MKHVRRRLPLSAMLLFASATALANPDYPNKPIRLLVGFPAGGSTDVLSRQIAQQLSVSFRQQVVVDNRAGAAGNIASEVAARANPDGHTLLMATVSSHGINPALYRKVPYEPVKDFTPITLIASYPLVLAMNPTVPAKSVRELIDLAKAKPGSIRFSSSGNGSPGHLSGEIFKALAKVDLGHVPYKGGAPSTVAVIAGEAQITFATLPGMMPHIKSGKVVAPAVTTAKRSPALPGVPTIAESGLPGFDVSSWAGIVAPAGLSKPVIAKLHSSLVEVLKNPTVRERLSAEGAEPVGNRPEEFGAFIKTELAKWALAVKQAGAQVD